MKGGEEEEDGRDEGGRRGEDCNHDLRSQEKVAGVVRGTSRVKVERDHQGSVCNGSNTADSSRHSCGGEEDDHEPPRNVRAAAASAAAAMAAVDERKRLKARDRAVGDEGGKRAQQQAGEGKAGETSQAAGETRAGHESADDYATATRDDQSAEEPRSTEAQGEPVAGAQTQDSRGSREGEKRKGQTRRWTRRETGDATPEIDEAPTVRATAIAAEGGQTPGAGVEFGNSGVWEHMEGEGKGGGADPTAATGEGEKN